MKLKTLKPLYLGGRTLVEGATFVTIEQHGRELVQKGYAEADSTDAEPIISLDEEASAGAGVLTSESVTTVANDKLKKAPAKQKAG